MGADPDANRYEKIKVGSSKLFEFHIHECFVYLNSTYLIYKIVTQFCQQRDFSF